MKYLRLLTLVLALANFLPRVYAGNTATNSGGGHTATMTVSYNTTTGVATWTCSWVRAEVVSGGPAIWIYTTTGFGGGYGSAVHDHGGISTGSGSHSGTFTPTPGTWYRLGARVVNISGDVSDVHEYWEVPVVTPPDNKVTISLPINRSDKAKTYKLIQGGTEVGTVTLEPGEGLIQTFTVPAGTAVTVVELVEDLEQDGPVWVDSPGTVTQVTVGTATPTAVPSGDPDPAPTTITPENVQPEKTTTTNTQKNVWEPTVNVTSGSSDFTVKAYREGVDKIVAAINGETTATNPDVTAPAAIWAPETSVATSALSKLPAAPVITAPAPLTAVTFTLQMPKIDGSALVTKNISVDFSVAPYATPIAVFRGICLACMTGLFFYISFMAVRSAFAGK